MEIALKALALILVLMPALEATVNARFASIYMSRLPAMVILRAALVGLLIMGIALLVFHRGWGEASMRLAYPLSIMMGLSVFLSIIKEKALKPKRRVKARGG